MHRKLMLGVLALATCALALPTAAAAQSNTVELSAKLKGANEVPEEGDPDGKGEITVQLKPAKEKVCFVMEIRKLDGATAGHIHKGDAETAGPVKVTLFEEAIEGTGSYEGCVKNVKPELIEKIAAKPENFYVNIHNEEFPDGAIRGQLEPTGDEGGGGAERAQFIAKLSGKDEVPGPGDENGRGEAILSAKPAKGKICWQVSWLKIEEPTAAHIHKGGPDDAGPVKVALFEEAQPTDIAEGCARDLDEKLVQKIADNPERFYVNVHNEEFPDGAIRGQLEPVS